MHDLGMPAQAYGIAIEVTDLGGWGSVQLLAEYDSTRPAIRINQRALDRYRATLDPSNSAAVRNLLDFAIAHELYHHREAIGEVAILPTRRQREEAADAYARANVSLDAALDAYLKAGG